MWELFWQSAWKVVVAGLVLGAGLPAVFALGVRSTAVATAGGGGAGTGGGASATLMRVLAVVCFALVVVAVALGITIVVAAGLGKQVSFEHVYPTIVAKS